MITFPVAVTKIPDKKQLKGVGLFLTVQGDTVDRGGGVVSRSQDIPSVTRKQRRAVLSLPDVFHAAWDLSPSGTLPDVKVSLTVS